MIQNGNKKLFWKEVRNDKNKKKNTIKNIEDV